ncbi:Gamma-glutamyl hydrolase A [Holothuria leucospilota]|uniref:folate gamma-glutamyl hydrolase n=1 Tax=Holothuria leucospilota TaxID=206669 RepID=A0A9Q1C3B3_HOLLE|nr:Gamma-glutamyl hydrolase A [Holothuria leucospilota]
MHRGRRSTPDINTPTDNKESSASVAPNRSTSTPLSGFLISVSSNNIIMHYGRKFRPYSVIIISIILAIVLFSCCTSRSVKGSPKAFNYRPIVGVLTQASPPIVREYGSTYIPATYVQFIALAGARVVPVFVNQSYEYYVDLFNSINGVLWPGGGLDDILGSGYGRAGKIFYDLAMKSYQKEDYFPIWGTCQGFELMVSLAAGKDVLAPLKSYNKNLNVTFTKGYSHSKMMSGASKEVLDALRTKAVTYNGHKFSLTPTNYTKSATLHAQYDVLATSVNEEGREFIALIEAKDYPFYGVQFHPEKPLFTWSTKTSIKHDPTTLMVSQYFSNFFVNEARKNGHAFADPKKEEDALIFNYKLVYLKGKQNLDQAYFFDY